PLPNPLIPCGYTRNDLKQTHSNSSSLAPTTGTTTLPSSSTSLKEQFNIERLDRKIVATV
ncbi:unnamed protein product, partial [Didymodactylos carnosus]